MTIDPSCARKQFSPTSILDFGDSIAALIPDYSDDLAVCIRRDTDV